MIDKSFIEYVQNQDIYSLYTMLGRINKNLKHEHYEFVLNHLATKTNEDVDNIPDYSDYSYENLIEEKKTLENTNKILQKAIVENILNTKLLVHSGDIATRTSRFFAHIIDGLIISIPSMVFMMFYFENNDFLNFQDKNLHSIIANIGKFAAYSFLFIQLFFLLLNAKLLYTKGQTIGKKLLRIRIVTLEKELPSFKTVYFIRTLLFEIIYQIPFLGGIISLVDSLFILGNEKRCLHDYVAKTKVIVA